MSANQVVVLMTVAAYLLLALAFAYLPGTFASKMLGNRRWRTFLRILPPMVGAGAFIAVIAVLPTIVTNPVLIGIAGGLSAIIGLYMPRSLADKEEQYLTVAVALGFLALIMILIADGIAHIITPTRPPLFL